MHNIFSNTSFCSVFSEFILTMTVTFVKPGGNPAFAVNAKAWAELLRFRYQIIAQ